ncbi:type VI secretion system contractile sheath small subunit [Acetobacter vaccinii]|uniref:Type VI secretion system contractile sheath small subunit n=1 Tax=Acetobacter vaccinii TaxID=2592655 RepID=A0A5C1YMZ8_9PROT|nr:type VI secretion system contractile sheath small subunit [Acetobacter vaccinii]QEO16467.1 type VI secretion system contractile sheath small subunit [Acetobacter vaccinii]
MAQSSSIAPKERVNIKYSPATGAAAEEVELPHKLLMIGDYTQRADETPLEERDRMEVNKDNFKDVMSSQKLHLDLKVPNRLDDAQEQGEPAGEMTVSLDIATLKDMEPAAIVEKVPELRQLLDLRRALTALKGPLGNMPAFRKAIESILADETLRARLIDEIGGQDKA